MHLQILIFDISLLSSFRIPADLGLGREQLILSLIEIFLTV